MRGTENREDIAARFNRGRESFSINGTYHFSPLMLSATRGVVRLTLHVQPGARRAAIVGVHGDALKVAVQAPPIDGKANDAILSLIADAFQLPARDVSIVSGHTARRKVVALEGLSLAEAELRLRAILSSTE
ncbi:MAG: DUF167 domain-containing protein [Gemmatimonadaceae bacterium]